jgi:hypothetical protein
MSHHLQFKYVYDLVLEGYSRKADVFPQLAANSEEEVFKRYKKMYPDAPKLKSVKKAYEIKHTKKSKNE